MTTTGDKVYKMLSFQYKPLEASIKKMLLARPGGADAWKVYQALPAIKKIQVLDNYASKLNL
jgi:hypothetical protein